MALQQHFRDTGHRTQACVDHKRRMHRPKVRQGSFANEVLIDFIRVIPLTKPGAAVHPVSQGPASGFVAAQIQRFTCSPHPVPVIRINQGPWIEGAEMGNVAVLGIADIAVVRFLAVFLELSIRADLDWIESANLIADRFEEGLCFAQQVGQGERVGEGFPDEALVESASCGGVIPSTDQASRHPLDLLGLG